jgi:predicted phage terminase large subunit-like protein
MQISPHLLISAQAKFQEVSERDECEESLYAFLKKGWKYIDPAPFIGGWHLEAIAEHLQAVTDGQIRRLIINVPPRTSKSSICSVAWPAWTWAQSRVGPCSGPHVQFLSASYAQTLSLRDSVKNRRLIESPFYKKYWGNRFSMTSDVNTKGRFENDRGGYRIATSVDGALTGEGAQIILIDDPHNATESESELVRTSTLQWWDEAMSTRLNDQHTGAYVVIMQRLHQEDLTGHIVRREANDWTWLMLPMEHEKARHCVTMVNGAKFWEDPRTEENELLCPDRFNAEAIKRLKTSLREFGTAGQLQQSPIPRGGGIIKEEWWGQYLDHTLPTFEYIIASLDTAYTEKEENDASALTIWGIYKNDNEQPRIMLISGWQERLALHELVEAVVSTCTTKPLPQTSKYRGYRRVAIDKLVIESKASGISVYQELQRVIGFSGQFAIDLFNPSKLGDKWARVHSVAHLFSEGLVYVPWPKEKDGPNKGQAGPHPYKWAEDIIDQITIFPRGAHDDFVDSMSMGLRWLRDSGLLLRNEEHTHDELEERVYRGRSIPLYPV